MSETRQFVETPIGSFGRAILFGMTLLLISSFGVALLLNPDPRGFGTHQQLGLPPCTFRLLFGYPCPGCGMTTCFAHFVRGQFREAVRANLVGTILASVSALLIPWSLWSLYRGRLWMVSDPVRFAAVLTFSFAGLSLLVWMSQLIAQFGFRF